MKKHVRDLSYEIIPP